MSRVYICNLHEMPTHVAALAPSHLVSLLTAEQMPDTPPGLAVERHLKVACHDIVADYPGAILPGREHAERIVSFAESWDARAPMVVHCWAGVSRSSAAALIVACTKAPGREEELARRLRRVAPHVQPNLRLIEIGDEVLGRAGALVRAVRAMGLGRLVERGPLVELELFAEPR